MARYWWPNDPFEPYTLHISSTIFIGPEGSFVPQGQMLYEAFEFLDECFLYPRAND
jgi:hypothetical protein